MSAVGPTGYGGGVKRSWWWIAAGIVLVGGLAWAGGPAAWLGRLAAGVYGSRFAPTDEFVYRQVEGGDLVLARFEPPDRGPARRPAVLFVHGGGWTTGDRAMLYPYAHAFAAEGWAAFSVGYRTFGSHGTDAHAALEDVRAALRTLRDRAEEFRIDPSRIVVGGGSAGGHLSAAAAMIEPEAPVAALLLFNPAIDTSLDPVPPRWGAIAERFSGRGREISPTHHVLPGQPPAIVFHGQEDRLVPIEHVRRFCDEMRGAGNVCELEEFEEAGHAFFNHGFGYFDAVLARSLEFLAAQGLTGR